MAKLFYTLEEAAERLGKSEAEIKEMVESGRLQEFRDRDRLMFKRDQVDLLAPHEDDILSSSKSGSGAIPLAESGELGAIPLASDSGTGIPLESPKEQTGISIFEADQTEEADPSAVTQITETTPGDLQLETMGSGSGLLDLTREADDTSLGQNLLEGSQPAEQAVESSGEAEVEGSAAGFDAAAGGAMFESTGAETETAGAGAAAVLAAMAEPYDGGGSGLAGGLALGMILTLATALTLTIFGLMGSGGPLVEMFRGNPTMWMGIMAGVVFVPGIIGWLLGRRG